MTNTFFTNSYHAFPMLNGMSFGLLTVGVVLFSLLLLVVLVLKGYALWNAARRGETAWFIALLIVNTVGILELIYLYFIVGKWRNKDSSTASSDTKSSV